MLCLSRRIKQSDIPRQVRSGAKFQTSVPGEVLFPWTTHRVDVTLFLLRILLLIFLPHLITPVHTKMHINCFRDSSSHLLSLPPLFFFTHTHTLLHSFVLFFLHSLLQSFFSLLSPFSSIYLNLFFLFPSLSSFLLRSIFHPLTAIPSVSFVYS